MAEIKPVIRYEDCAKCGKCVRVCPQHAITLDENGPVIQCTPECAQRCTYSTEGFLCIGEEVCPNNVISWEFEIVFEDEAVGEQS